jgi:hypothetical protein
MSLVSDCSGCTTKAVKDVLKDVLSTDNKMARTPEDVVGKLGPTRVVAYTQGLCATWGTWAARGWIAGRRPDPGALGIHPFR